MEIFITFFAGFAASFLVANVGGAGFISIPFLIFLGLPAQTAIATNRVASLGFSTSSYLTFRSRHYGQLHLTLLPFACVFFGTYLGANVLTIIPDNVLEKGIAVVMLLLLGLIAKNPHKGVREIKHTTNTYQRYFGYLLFILAGFYAGAVSAGFGTLAIYIYIFIYGKTFLESAATVHLLNIGSSLVAVGVYAFAGIIFWDIAIALATGMIVGGHFGTRYGIYKGNIWVRNLFIIIVLISAIKLLS